MDKFNEWLQEQDITQTEFGQLMERQLSQSAISKWNERGAIPPAHIAEVHRITGLPLHELDPFGWPHPNAA